jgi:hypothetical protein
VVEHRRRKDARHQDLQEEVGEAHQGNTQEHAAVRSHGAPYTAVGPFLDTDEARDVIFDRDLVENYRKTFHRVGSHNPRA